MTFVQNHCSGNDQRTSQTRIRVGKSATGRAMELSAVAPQKERAAVLVATYARATRGGVECGGLPTAEAAGRAPC
jgi:hypothetical protein